MVSHPKNRNHSTWRHADHSRLLAIRRRPSHAKPVPSTELTRPTTDNDGHSKVFLAIAESRKTLTPAIAFSRRIGIVERIDKVFAEPPIRSHPRCCPLHSRLGSITSLPNALRSQELPAAKHSAHSTDCWCWAVRYGASIGCRSKLRDTFCRAPQSCPDNAGRH